MFQWVRRQKHIVLNIGHTRELPGDPWVHGSVAALVAKTTRDRHWMGTWSVLEKNPRRANERFGPENNASHVHVFGIGPWYHSSREHKAPQRRPRQRRAYHQAKNAHTKIWNMRRRWRMIFCQVNFFFLFFLVRLSLFYRICDANCLLGEKPLCHTLHMTSGDQPKIGPYTKFKRFLLFYSACTPPLSCPRSFTHIYSLFSIHSYSFMLANY